MATFSDFIRKGVNAWGGGERFRLGEGLPNVSCTETDSECFRCVDHMVPVTTTQLFRCGSRAAADGPEMNGHGWVPAKLFTNRLWPISPMDHTWAAPGLGSVLGTLSTLSSQSRPLNINI